jgi:hypothetical protein
MVPLREGPVRGIEGSAMPHYLRCGKIGLHWEPHFQCAGAHRAVTPMGALLFLTILPLCSIIVNYFTLHMTTF